MDAGSKAILEANPSFASLLGYQVDHLADMTFYDLAAQEPADLDSDFDHLLINGQGFLGERRYKRQDGTLIDVEVSASHILSSGRDVLVVVLRDITSRKQSEKALRESEERYELATQGANDGLWDWNLKTNEIYYSSRWKSMLGYENEEISNKPDEWISRIHPEDLQQMQVQLDAHLKVSPLIFRASTGCATATEIIAGCSAVDRQSGVRTASLTAWPAHRPILRNGSR